MEYLLDAFAFMWINDSVSFWFAELVLDYCTMNLYVGSFHAESLCGSLGSNNFHSANQRSTGLQIQSPQLDWPSNALCQKHSVILLKRPP